MNALTHWDRIPNAQKQDLLSQWLTCPAYSWSIGTPHLRGEFIHAKHDQIDIQRTSKHVTAQTSGGAIQILTDQACQLVSERHTNASTGETTYDYLWKRHTAAQATRHLQYLGTDQDAIRPQERHWHLYDLGIGSGSIQMILRSNNPQLIDTLHALIGTSLFTGYQRSALYAAILQHQPHRVVSSAIGRIEVYQAIPAINTQTPSGPHTHVFAPTQPHALTDFHNAARVDSTEHVLCLHTTQALTWE